MTIDRSLNYEYKHSSINHLKEVIGFVVALRKVMSWCNISTSPVEFWTLVQQKNVLKGEERKNSLGNDLRARHIGKVRSCQRAYQWISSQKLDKNGSPTRRNEMIRFGSFCCFQSQFNWISTSKNETVDLTNCFDALSPKSTSRPGKSIGYQLCKEPHIRWKDWSAVTYS